MSDMPYEISDKARVTITAIVLAVVLAVVLVGALPAGAQSTLDIPKAGQKSAAPQAAPTAVSPKAPQSAAPTTASSPAGTSSPAAGTAKLSSATTETRGGIPKAFRAIELGMDRETVIAALMKDYIFAYRGPEDVSLLPSPNQSLIDVAGMSFVKRGYFQFLDGKLWVMILVLNPDKIDHYSVYTSLADKYGKPALLDPKEARWEDGATRLALERPLTLRYMDIAVYGKLREGSATKESAVELDRQEFLRGL